MLYCDTCAVTISEDEKDLHIRKQHALIHDHDCRNSPGRILPLPVKVRGTVDKAFDDFFKRRASGEFKGIRHDEE